MGATLAGLRAVPVPVDADWHLDLGAVDDGDAGRALVLWLNDPANPTGAGNDRAGMAAAVAWARERGIIVASDECYAEFTYDDVGRPAGPVTALGSGSDGVLAVHSLSKRSNMAGLRAGFVAGDADLVGYLGEIRKHGGLMTPAPVQAAAAAALGDDTHVERTARPLRGPAPAPAPRARGVGSRPRRRPVHLLSVAAPAGWRGGGRLVDHPPSRRDRTARRPGRSLRARRVRPTSAWP